MYVDNRLSPELHLPAEPTVQGILALLPLQESACR